MTEKIFSLKIVTPEGVYLEKEVQSLVAPGVLGYFGVLRDHAPFVTGLAKGVLTLRGEDGQAARHAVDGGFFEVSENRALVLTEKITGAEPRANSSVG